MQEISIPTIVDAAATTNCTDYVEKLATDSPQKAIFGVRDDSDGWRDITAEEFRSQVVEVAKGLIAAGIKPGDRVGIMSRTRYEWTLVDLAIWYAGGISVPIYETSAVPQVAWNLKDSGAIAAFGETEEHLNKIRAAVEAEKLKVSTVWQLTDTGLNELRTAGKEVDDATVETRRSAANKQDTATIIYTSGTTGNPKGVELSHGNFIDTCNNAIAAIGSEVFANGAQTIMFLPLAHIFGRFIAIVNLAAGTRTGHTPDIKHVLEDFQSFQPTYILAVPRVFEKVYNSSVAKAESEGKGKIFAQAADTAIAYSRALQAGKVGLGLKIKHKVFDLLVYSKLRTAMGGRLQYAVSGGGPLGERLGHFFHGIGVLILEGYGLTETTAPVTVNRPEKIKIGSVGTPIPGCGVKISDDGEVLARGVCVMKGYYQRKDLDAEAFTGEWFRTGDLGSIDEDGYLHITGRKKEILVTAGGKNVSPAQLEDPIRASALVSQCMVIGEGKPFIAALITLDPDMLPKWAEQHNLGNLTLAAAAQHELVQAEVQKAIAIANANVSHAETIKAFRILDTDFSEQSGHLTPSLKLKRAQVMTDFADVVQDIYGD